MQSNIERYDYSIINSIDGSEVSSHLIVDAYQTINNPFTKSSVILGIANQQHVAVKFSGYEWGPKREWEGLIQANQAGVPSPKILFTIKDQSERFGIVSEKIYGTNLYKNPSEELRLEFGNIVREMHDHIPIIGREWQESGRSDFSYYSRIMKKWRKSETMEINSNSRSQALLSELSNTIDTQFKSFKSVFVHGDLHNDQVIVTRSNNLCVIDFENWQEEHPLYDLAIYLFHTLRTKQNDSDFINFFKGYTGNISFTDMDKNIISFYLLFTTMRAVDYYAKLIPTDLKFAIINLQHTLSFIHTEKLWKLT